MITSSHQRRHLPLSSHNLWLMLLMAACTSLLLAFGNLTKSIAATIKTNGVATPTLQSSLLPGANPVSGKVLMCARALLEFEAIHLLPWIAQHHRAGISFFHMYMELDGKQLQSLQAQRVYDTLSRIPFVTIHNSTEHKALLHEGSQVMHCLRMSSDMAKRNEIAWVVDADIDELFAFGPNPGSTPERCLDQRLSTNGLRRFLNSMTDDTVAVVIPRVSFGTNNHIARPLEQTQTEAYSKRKDFSELPKVIVRAGTITPTRMDSGELRLPNHSLYQLPSKHYIETRASTFASALVMSPDGARLMGYQQLDDGKQVVCNETHLDNPEAWCMHHTTLLTGDVWLNNLRLHHYTSRSTEECQNKLDNKYVQGTWRNVDSNRGLCTQTGDIDDHSLSCAGKTERRYCYLLLKQYEKDSKWIENACKSLALEA